MAFKLTLLLNYLHQFFLSLQFVFFFYLLFFYFKFIFGVSFVVTTWLDSIGFVLNAIYRYLSITTDFAFGDSFDWFYVFECERVVLIFICLDGAGFVLSKTWNKKKHIWNEKIDNNLSRFVCVSKQKRNRVESSPWIYFICVFLLVLNDSTKNFNVGAMTFSLSMQTSKKLLQFHIEHRPYVSNPNIENSLLPDWFSLFAMQKSLVNALP